MHHAILPVAVVTVSMITLVGQTRPPMGMDVMSGNADHTSAHAAVAGDGIGPDVITGHCSGTVDGGSMNGPMFWGAHEGERAFSVGTVSCNVGDAPINWMDEGDTPTLHPVIAQNIYRMKTVNGAVRFEQIGMSWVKHGFCALQQDWCETCTPVGPACEDQLGVGCSDPYDPFLNGIQFRLGPRSEINPATGEVLVWPYTPVGISTVLDGRVRIKDADLDPALNSGARYFAEAQYVAQDDALAGNDDNNASYRECEVTGIDFVLPYIADTVRMKAAVFAWQDNDKTGTVNVSNVDVPDDGRFHLGFQVTDLGNGLWHYEYALHNLNSDRAAQAFIVPALSCVEVSSIGWHGVPHHSGEIYATADWVGQRDADDVVWATDAFDVDPLANALRWGTMFNYRFIADAPPVPGAATIGLFRPGAPDTIAVDVLVPGIPASASDCADDGDGITDVIDLLALLSQWGGPGSCDIAPEGGDGVVGIADLLTLLAEWGENTCQ